MIKNFFSNIIIRKNIKIFIYELNKVYDMRVQSLDSKENK